KSLHGRYPDEPYRLLLSGLRSRLLAADQADQRRLLLGQEGADELRTVDLAQVLDLIAESLQSHRGALLGEGELKPVARKLSLLGRSVARLDLRQHSSRHESALTDIFKALGLTPDYGAMNESERLDLLLKVLALPPLAVPSANFGAETSDVL